MITYYENRPSGAGVFDVIQPRRPFSYHAVQIATMP